MTTPRKRAAAPASEISLREFFEEKFTHLEGSHTLLRDKADQIIDKLDITNGRVRKAEIAIAVLQWAYAAGAAVLAAWFFNLLKQP